MFVIVLITFSIIPGNAMGSIEIQGDYKENGVIPQNWFVTYHINITDSEKILNIKIITSDYVDFYLLTEEEYQEYLDPAEDYFDYEKMKENSKIFEWQGSGEYYLVIDNMNLSLSGAMSHGDVDYTIVATLQEKSFSDKIADHLGDMVCTTIIIVAIATTYWLYKRPKIEEVLK